MVNNNNSLEESVENASLEESIVNTGFKDVPEWLKEDLFEEFLKNDIPNYEKITKFVVKPAVTTGENFMTVMLRVSIEVKLKDSTKTNTSYMIKINPTLERMQIMVKEWKLFIKEHTTYSKYIPAFEEYYQKVGRKIKFAPRLLEPTKSNINDDDFIILEDLKINGFKNFDRHLGLDMIHTKAVLQKLAQLHAASAKYFLQMGPYPAMYDQCLSAEEDLFEEHRLSINQIFRECLDLYGGLEHLNEKLKTYAENRPDSFQLKSDWKQNEFNVLNHGDCWTNNIMFQYDQDGKLNETYFIDLQMSRFGSPAQDLLYFLLSSTNIEIKVKYFDYFIYYYHEQLIENLKLLNYEGKIPQLRDIHADLLKYDYWAYTSTVVLMPVLLCESRDDANIDNLIDENNDGFKRFMYINSLYVNNMKILLPWLENRGTFDL